jgi:predicted transcriptional regulator
MRSITLSLDADWKTTLRQAGEQFKKAWRSGEYQGEFIGFATPALLFDSLTPIRWELLSAIQGTSHPLQIPELVLILGRESEAIQGDIRALLDLGLIERGSDGALDCPFDEIRTEFALKRAA